MNDDVRVGRYGKHEVVDKNIATVLRSAVTQINERNIIEEANIHAAIKELNKDEDEGDGMSSIDMRARLSAPSLKATLRIDALVVLHALPNALLQFTRQTKRSSVSLNGLGRKEIVDLNRSQVENDMAIAKAGAPVQRV